MEDVNAEQREMQMAKLLRTALEVIWIHEQMIGDLIDQSASIENFVRVNAPEFYDRYQKIRESVVHQSYEQHRSTIERAEQAMENARKLVTELEAS